MNTIKTYLAHADKDEIALLGYVLRKDLAYLYAHTDECLSHQHHEQLMVLIEKLKKGVPLAYLTGEQHFYKLIFAVNEHTLIPRPETELLIDIALNFLSADNHHSMLDLGTGCGAIAISLKHQRPKWLVCASDIDRDTLMLAEQNAKHHQCDMHFYLSDWFTKIDRRFDLIVANPPYIKDDDPHLVNLSHESPRALLGCGKNGLAAIRHICRYAPNYLNKAGGLLLEHGYHQQDDVAALLSEQFSEIQRFNDLSGIPRAVFARL